MSKDATRKTKGTPDSVDVHVGKRLRVRRSLLGMSQEKLADAIGITFQQIQKYERGMNRISAGRLYQFSKILQIPINYFYDEVIDPSKGMIKNVGLSDNEQEGFQSSDAMSNNDVMNNKETIDLVRTYYSISDPDLRKDTIKFMKAMASKT